jgi:hypothetical protein
MVMSQPANTNTSHQHNGATSTRPTRVPVQPETQRRLPTQTRQVGLNQTYNHASTRLP